MAAKCNFTKDETQEASRELFCSAEFTKEVHSELIFLSVVNTFLALTAFLGNTLILLALQNETSLHPPSKLLYRCLAMTDLSVGVILQPLFVAYWMSVVNQRWDICYYADLLSSVTAYFLSSVSLMTLSAISVDRLLALLLGLRYRQAVTLKRACITVIVIFIVGLICASTYFWNPLVASWIASVGLLLCLITSIFCYTKIFISLCHSQVQVQDQVSQGQTLLIMNAARYRKAVFVALYIQVILVICYLPIGLAVTLTSQRKMPLSTYLARQFTSSFLLLNSSLNPLLYCWRLKEVRQAVKGTVKKIFLFTVVELVYSVKLRPKQRNYALLKEPKT